jgi:hypothetical protein
MPNSIKYNVSAETLALKKGNFWIGTGDVGKGPTNVTGYYNGITPPSNGYTIYLNKSSNGPSIYTPNNDVELINLTNKIAGASYTTVAQCLTYYMEQTDKMVLNLDYPPIVTNGLVLNLDAGFTPSYPRTGTVWSNLSGSNNGTLVNSPTYSDGSIVFDGVDDCVTISTITLGNGNISWTINAWIKTTTNANGLGQGSIISNSSGGPVYSMLGVNGGKIVYWTYQNSNWAQKLGNTTINDGNWHMLTWVNYNNYTMDMYVDGVLDASVANSTSGNNNPLDIIGSSWAARYNGSISNLFIYQNKSLTSQEVLQNYNSMDYLGSMFNPANSAAAILLVNPSATDGYYWINTNLGPKKLYCIMSQGGWMGVTSEISPQISNLSTSASWESNSLGRLQGSNSQILNVLVQEGNCGAPTHYQLQNPNTVGISYTQTMLLIQRVSTIGQCSEISNGGANGWYNGPTYLGTYTSYGMCNWGDYVFANNCCDAQNVVNLKTYWVMFGNGTNPNLRYQVQCAGGSGQHYHMWFIK